MSAGPTLVCEALVAGDPPAWRGLDLVLQPGQAAVVAGGGRGKFLLFQLILGQTRRTSGTLRTLGHDPDTLSRQALLELRSRCGLAPHAGALISNLSIRDNVALPLRYHAICSEAEVAERVEQTLSDLGVAHFSDRRPAALNPEHQRLIGVARVLAYRPMLMLVQDPYEGLDDLAADRVHAQLSAVIQRGSSALFTTQVTRVDRAYDGKLADLCGSRVVTHTE